MIMYKTIRQILSLTVVGSFLLLSGCSHSDGSSSSVDKEFSTVKRTGIIQSYTAFDDGDYQAGLAQSYTRDNSLEVVVDNTTGLMWQDDGNNLNQEVTFIEASTYCTNMTIGSYNDWRAPTIDELLFLGDRDYFGPAVDTSVFINVANYVYYWSSSEMSLRTGQAWAVYSEAWTDHYRNIPLSNTYHALCVRNTI